ncbi:MAG TPA: hypothetical protein VHM29_07100 [Acidimicrobiia bacterium]|nr:hypothetical protein [Acidimicrobiia bacterium]
MKRLSLVAGAAIGATVVYLFDPVQGRRRRKGLARRIGRSVDALRPGRDIGSRSGPKSSEWELPMATVNIDIDQGTVTLRGAFPSSDEHPARMWAHGGLNRVRGHAAARRGFGGSDQG